MPTCQVYLMPKRTREQSESSGARVRAWAFTAYDEEIVGRLKTEAGIAAMVVGEEICPTTGRLHYQGYIRFEQPRRFSWWKLHYPPLHVDPRKGTEMQNAVYCRKDKKVLIDFGIIEEVRSREGDPDMITVARKIMKGVPKGVILREHWRTWLIHGHKLRPFYIDIREQIDAGTWEEPDDI